MTRKDTLMSPNLATTRRLAESARCVSVAWKEISAGLPTEETRDVWHLTLSNGIQAAISLALMAELSAADPDRAELVAHRIDTLCEGPGLLGWAGEAAAAIAHDRPIGLVSGDDWGDE